MKINKILSFIIAFAMILGTMSISVSAETQVLNVATQDEFNTALSSVAAGDVIVLTSGTYELGTPANDVTIKAAEDASVTFDNIGARNCAGKNMTFENIIFDYYPNVGYTGLQHSGNLTYNNCTINGQVFLYGVSETFNNCTFNQNSADAYNVWTYCAEDTTFNNCVFNSAGKSVLVYNEDATGNVRLSVNECEFIASAPVEGKAAIEIDTSFSKATVVIDDDTTAENFGKGNKSGDSLWNNKKFGEENLNDSTVVVGPDVVQFHKKEETSAVAYVGAEGYASIAEAFAAADDGDVVIIMEGTYDGLSINKSNISVVGQGKVDINGQLSVRGYNVYVANFNVNNPGDCAGVISGTGEFEKCTFVGKHGFRWCYTNGEVEYKSCVIKGDVYGIHFDGNCNGTIEIEDCTIQGWTSFAGTIDEVTIEDTVFEEGNYNQLRFYQDAKVTGCTFNPEMCIDSGDDGKGMENITLTFTECEVSDGSSFDDRISFAASAKGNVTVDGNAPTGLIMNRDDLLSFAKIVNAGNDFKGKTIKLGADIEMMDEEQIVADFTPIGTGTHPFRGTFDGQGYKISELYATYYDDENSDEFDNSFVGLFGKTEDATIKNVTVVNPYFIGKSYIGGIVGCAYTGVVENCHIIGEIDIEGYYMVGGITGHGYAKITNCSVVGDKDWDYSYIGAEYYGANLEGDNVGGIVGHRAEGSGEVISGCHVENVTIEGTRKVGGIAGLAFINNTIKDCSVKNITVRTNASAEYAADNKKSMGVGGIIGLYQAASGEGQLIGSRVDGVTLEKENDIEASMGYVTGGLRASDNTTTPVKPAIATYAEVIGVNSGATNGFMGSAQKISVKFKKVDEDKTNRTYNIIISGDGDSIINDFESAHFTFVNNSIGIDYTITPNTDESITAVDDISNPDRISFYRNANENNTNEIAKNEIVLGTVKFDGYGTVNFSIDTNDAKVNATTMSDNIVNTFIPEFITGNDGMHTLFVDNSGLYDVVYAEQKRNLKVTISFNNDITSQSADYTEMAVEVTGQNGEKHLGLVGDEPSVKYDAEMVCATVETDGKTVTIPFTVTAGYRYTVKLTGAGYRTTEYTTVIPALTPEELATDNGITLTFWNNVKENFNKTEIEKESGRYFTKNFLAGEIVQDNVINKYDLAAVVSYFGEDNLVTSRPGYNKYDLNRDGVIDSEDIAYVLVSFGE